MDDAKLIDYVEHRDNVRRHLGLVESARGWLRANNRVLIPKNELEALIDELGLDAEDEIQSALEDGVIKEKPYRGLCYKMV